MKPFSRLFLPILVLAVGLWACQDQVISPDATDLELKTAFAKGGKPGKPDGGGDGGTLTLRGKLWADGTEDVEWSIKKGIFKAYATMEVTTKFGEPGETPFPKSSCHAIPGWDDPRAGELWAELNAGWTTSIAGNVHVDLANTGAESGLHRVFIRVGGPVVRYYWVGPRYQFEEMFSDDGTVTGFEPGEENSDVVDFTLSGGMIGVRDTGTPNEVVLIGCELDEAWAVNVTVDKTQ